MNDERRSLTAPSDGDDDDDDDYDGDDDVNDDDDDDDDNADNYDDEEGMILKTITDRSHVFHSESCTPHRLCHHHLRARTSATPYAPTGEYQLKDHLVRSMRRAMIRPHLQIQRDQQRSLLAVSCCCFVLPAPL